MYERFTDRARKVMQLASQEAQRFNHEYIGTEHILLGLVKEGSGVAAHVLESYGVDLRKVRLEVEKIMQPAPSTGVFIGKLPQTPHAKRVVELAIEEAGKLGDNYVGTEHLLLGLISQTAGSASEVLTALGLSPDVIRAEVRHLLTKGTGEQDDNPASPSTMTWVVGQCSDSSVDLGLSLHDVVSVTRYADDPDTTTITVRGQVGPVVAGDKIIYLHKATEHE